MSLLLELGELELGESPVDGYDDEDDFAWLSAEESERAIACGTFATAMIQLLRERGYRVHVGESYDVATHLSWRALMVATPRHAPAGARDIRYATMTMTPAHEVNWLGNPVSRSANRAGAVMTALTRLDDSHVDPAHVLTSELTSTSHGATLRDIATANAALPAWWETRLREGHTPESARMMLLLLAHPTLLAHLDTTTNADLDARGSLMSPRFTSPTPDDLQ